MATDNLPPTPKPEPKIAPVLATAPRLTSQDGVSYVMGPTDLLVNVTDSSGSPDLARRPTLKVDNKIYAHVTETTTGQWAYRLVPPGTGPIPSPTGPAARPAAAQKVEPTQTSDEGVSFTASPDLLHLTNVTDAKADPDKARRREIHVNGQPYEHAFDNAQGQWVYRRAS